MDWHGSITPSFGGPGTRTQHAGRAGMRTARTTVRLPIRLSSNGLTVRTSTPAEFLAIVETERPKIAGFAKILGSQIKP
jgi:hypothetical protein